MTDEELIEQIARTVGQKIEGAAEDMDSVWYGAPLWAAYIEEARAILPFIHADREAVRAPLLAEIERLRRALWEIRNCTDETKPLKLISAALEERAVMSEERSKIMDNLIAQDADLIDKLRDEDSYYRIQEKHWCIDAEELERQRLAAADLIETQAREIERLREAWKEPRAWLIADEETSWVTLFEPNPKGHPYCDVIPLYSAALGENHDR